MEQPKDYDTETAICEICSESFVPDGRRKSRCSRAHYRECEHCGEDFILQAKDKITKAFCSRVCSNRARSRIQICPICGESFAERSKTCSQECSNKLRSQTRSSQPELRSCMDCGEEFKSLFGRLYCERQHIRNCEVCGESFDVEAGSKRKTCSNSCAGALINSEDSMVKRKITSRDRYGTDFPQQSEEVKAKITASNLERFGYSSPLGSPELREATRQKMLEVYGVEWYNQTDFAKEKLRGTNMERYGVPNVFMVPEFQEKSRESIRRSIEENGGRKFPRISQINRIYAERLRNELGIEVEFEAPFGKAFADLRVISGDREFLIDIHPTVSHNSHLAFGCLINGCPSDCSDHSAILPSYHQTRARQALAEDRKLIQWYGWNDLNSLVALLKPKLQPASRLSARKLELVEISQKTANRFLKEFHIQGAARGQSHCYGLQRDGELLAVATFGKSRFGSSLDYEFIRYAVRPGYVIYGGGGRVVDRFLSDVPGGSLISYVDFDHTTAQSVFLLQTGFEEKNTTGPGMIWHRLADGKAVRNSSLLAQGADRLLGTSYGRRDEAGIGNSEIMLLEGFLPVHTSGNRVFELRP